MKQLKLFYPVANFSIIQHFAENKEYYHNLLGIEGHNGLDIFATDGTPVYAAHDGEVTFAGEDGSGGLGVVIRTLEPFEYKGQEVFYKTIYWHLKVNSILVKPNQKVKAGDKIAEADNTGLSTGSHLHFGLKPIAQGEQPWLWSNLEQTNGYGGAIDPEPYLNGEYAHAPEKPHFTFTFPLEYGMINVQDVRMLQVILLYEGLLEVTPTGNYFEYTRKAVLAWQKKHKVASLWELGVVRGKKVGPKSLAKLNELYGNI